MAKRNISEERKQQLREQLEKARAKKKPAEYKNVHSSVLALPDDSEYSFKNVKEWIKDNKEQIAALNKSARSFRTDPKDKQKASNLAESKKAYIRMCEHYLKTGDWIATHSGKEEGHKVVPRVTTMAYYPDGTPKRTVGYWYPDIEAIWTKEMDGQSPTVS
jgi:hypothetical protein|tara:strand:+ start:704 stop:1186 length:483 start_codon:yes stop_codon:yes gene_type:complete